MSDAAYNNIPLLLREKDRVEYARYVLTGHIFLMVAPPFLTLLIRRRFSTSELRVRAFFAPFILLARQLDFEGSLVSYIEKVFNNNLENLRKPIREGQIKITLKVLLAKNGCKGDPTDETGPS